MNKEFEERVEKLGKKVAELTEDEVSAESVKKLLAWFEEDTIEVLDKFVDCMKFISKKIDTL